MLGGGAFQTWLNYSFSPRALFCSGLNSAGGKPRWLQSEPFLAQTQKLYVTTQVAISAPRLMIWLTVLPSKAWAVR
jgi:hypothetical protein